MIMTCVPPRGGLFRGAFLISVSAISLAGCASLPVSGPTGADIRKAAIADQGQFPFTLVEVESSTQVPPPSAIPSPMLSILPRRPTDLLGPGDVLNITVYEAGVTLFGNSALRTATAAAA